MRRLGMPLLTTILMALSAKPGPADQIMTLTVTFDSSELSWETIGGYDLPRLSDCEVIREVGAPQLPVRAVQMAIAPNADVDHAEVLSTSSRILSGPRQIYPAQPPQILSLADEKSQAITFVEPRPDIYNGETPYPAQVVEYTGSSRMGQVHLASLVVYPLQYLPEQKRIRFYERIELAIHLNERGQKFPASQDRPARADHPQRRSVSRLIANGEDIGRYYPAVSDSAEVSIQEDLAEYVIITDLAFQEAFQELADWKTRKGVPARVVTLQEIDSQHQGSDRQERVRNFIAQAYQDWGTVYVLLAGDTQLIPVRYAYAMDSQTEYNDIPCDLYYADLNGDWNADGDEVYGEVEDEVDLLPEVFLGRAPVSTAAQAENFVRKVLTYERPSLLDYQQKALFAAEVLWSNPFTDASKSKDLIDERYLPERFDPVTKLYETLGNEDTYSVINALNQGQNIFNHDGHAYYSVMGMGSGYLDNSQVDYLHNGDRLGLIYSIGCWPAAFDYDCIAEHFVNNPQGGAVAFIGNSRYGWGSPGNPCFGYSDRFDQFFFKTVFIDGITRLGEALATTKAHYAPHSRQENVYRWHQYQITLLGDPEMPLWTQTPRPMAVSFPPQVPAETSLVAVTVTDGQAPLEQALICLMDGEEIYQRQLTDACGRASFTVCPTTSESLWVTATAAEFLPFKGQIAIIPGGPHLAIAGVEIEEISGNGDGAISPREQIGLGIDVKNWGNEMASGVTASLDWGGECITSGDTVIFLGDIAPRETISPGLWCHFTVHEACANGQPLRFHLHLQDGSDHIWNDEVGLTVATPVVVYQSSWLDDSGRGNGNGVPEAGEELDLHVALFNSGDQPARALVARMETADPFLQVNPSSVDLGDLEPQSSSQATFQLQVAWDCPDPQFSILEIDGSTDDGYGFQQQLLLTIGRVGFSDDLEAGSSYWSHWATDSWWHFTSRRVHSGEHSWYCGQEEDGSTHYVPGMDCSLTVLPVVVGPGATLSFWHWYDLATYGSDGLYVEVNDGSGWETLDFLGSGGALDSTLIGNDWLADTYDLSHVSPGTFLQVRFRFYSDEDDSVGQGVYLDDVSIACDVVSSSGQEPVPCRPLSFALSENFPNPFNASTRFVLSIPVQNQQHWGHLPVRATGRIYNVAGQRIKDLLDGQLGAGDHVLVWDGRDDSGRPVGSGIYFCRVEAGDIERTIKMVLLR